MEIFKPIKALLVVGACLISTLAMAQNDVMMQAFYWNVPVDETNLDGTWWDNLAGKSTELKNAGFTGIWVPSPAKGNWGITDMGYGIYDHYDLGNYNQKSTTETRFGSRSELESMISAMHDVSNNQSKINVYADVVLNHVYSSDDNDEVNPAVKEYVFDEAYRNGSQFVAYPTNEIKWVIPNASAGDYYIKVKGYLLPWSSGYKECGYDIEIDYAGTGFNGTTSWESEPNNGNGDTNVFPASGNLVQGFIDSSSDVDEYQVTVTGTQDIIIKLTAKRQDDSDNWLYSDQTYGYYPYEIWYNSTDLASTSLEAHTNTNITYVTHTGTGEKNYEWDYTDFHPVDENDWLGDWGSSDEIITNTKGFGNDFNTFDDSVQARLNDWGYWLADEVGFDGFRMDFVRGFQEEFASDWVSNLPLLDGSQRFIVGEYWGNAYRINSWVNTVAGYGADVDAFDFPLKFTLTSMCNGDATWDMTNLNHAGMVRNTDGNSLPGTSIVTFLDNHDTGKEHDKWVTQDWAMGYAYMLTHEGRPCVFYPHYYGVTLVDNDDNDVTISVDSDLQEDINKLIFVRETYLGGSLEVLTEVGNPYPSGDVSNVYVARREGNDSKAGAIVVINNSDATKGIWVDATPDGMDSWDEELLVNAFDDTQTTQVYEGGRVYVEAPARSYAIYVKDSDYEAYTSPSARKANISDVNEISSLDEFAFESKGIYPNPIMQNTAILPFTLPNQGSVSLSITGVNGQLNKTILEDAPYSKGAHEVAVNVVDFPSGVYVYQISFEGKTITKSFIVTH